ncbi:MAG: error-prone DNA polymerase, partial [Gammaproteobacteria bacterium]
MASSADARYAELHCVSNFTFLRGASHPEELVQRAHDLGYRALAMTDECSLAGVVRAWRVARELNSDKQRFHLIIGSEFRFDDGMRLVLLATSLSGYSALSQLITDCRRPSEKGSYHIERRMLDQGLPDCLALLAPPLPFAVEAVLTGQAQWLATRFPKRSWLLYERLLSVADEQSLQTLSRISTATGLPLAAAGDVHMHDVSRRPLQDVLTCIRHGCAISEAGQRLHPNGERHLRPRQKLARLYPQSLLEETLRIAQRCRFRLDEVHYQYPREIVPDQHTPASFLRQETEGGIRRRWPQGEPPQVRKLVEKELALIAELQYEPYFLTVYDIVKYARSRKILCQGRGSAANSAVCYCLGITEVDPARVDLLFERFISKERNEPPDIDVDFEHERREEVIQYIYRKYGRERAAIAAAVITYRPRSAVRDVGKALGLSLDQVDALAKSLAWWDGRKVKPERLRDAGFDPDSRVVSQLMTLVNDIIGFPRHLSQHTGGFIIARQKLSALVPIENASMIDRTIIQWDKDDLETLGFMKVDVLALGMLTAIRKTLDLIEGYSGRRLRMQDIPPDDPATYAMIQKADTIGVFQIESRAQMSMLPRLKPANYYDLVIEVAIMRPGPIQGGMVHPYLRRRQGREKVEYPSDDLRPVLERTLGIPIFQEQVIKLAMVAAGFSPGEADQLRRAMAAWKRKGGMEPFRKKLIEGMLARGYPRDFAEQIYQQILGFGDYGFPESHSASFALLAYVSSWLKAHEPAAFVCALINSQPMGFYRPDQLVQDARRRGVEVRPVDVLVSGWDCMLEKTAGNPALRMGLRLVKGMGRQTAETITGARRQRPFANIHDFAARTGLNRRELDSLASCGALRSLSEHRNEARWQVWGQHGTTPLLRQAPLFEENAPLPPPSEGQRLLDDYALTGLTLGRHPLALLRKKLDHARLLPLAQLKQLRHGPRSRA